MEWRRYLQVRNIYRFYFFISFSISFCKFLAKVLVNEDNDVGFSPEDGFAVSEMSVNFFIPIDDIMIKRKK